MILRNIKWLLISLCILLIIKLVLSITQSSTSYGYWIWNNNDLLIASDDSPFYLLQGEIHTNNNISNFQPFGLYPQPITQSNEVHVLLRLYNLPEPELVVNIYNKLKEDWKHQGTNIHGIQIDHDSTSHDLITYNQWLMSLRKLLKDEKLGITGLATWLKDDLDELNNLLIHVDYIAVQMYQSYAPHTNSMQYIPLLNNLTKPYFIGITNSREFMHLEYPCKLDCLGFIKFLNSKDEK